MHEQYCIFYAILMVFAIQKIIHCVRIREFHGNIRRSDALPQFLRDLGFTRRSKKISKEIHGNLRIKRPNNLPKEFDIKDEEPPKSKADDFDDYYLPYWKHGDREAFHNKKVKLYRFIKNGTTTPAWGPTTTAKFGTPLIPDTAHKNCLSIGRALGPICGRKLDTLTWKYVYKNFTGLCHMQNEIHADRFKRWYPIYTGYCRDQHYMQNTNPPEIVSHMYYWIGRITSSPGLNPNASSVSTKGYVPFKLTSTY